MVSKVSSKPKGRPRKSKLEVAAKHLSDANDAFTTVEKIIDEQLSLDDRDEYEAEEVQAHFNRRLELYLQIDEINSKKKVAKENGDIESHDALEASRLKTLSFLSNVPEIGYTSDDWDDMQDLISKNQRKPGKAKITIEQRYNRAKSDLERAQAEYRRIEKTEGVKKPKSFDKVISEEKNSRSNSGGYARKLSSIDTLDKDLLLAIRERDSIIDEINNPSPRKVKSTRGRKPTPLPVKLEAIEETISKLQQDILTEESKLTPEKLADTQIRRLQVAQRILRKQAKDLGFTDISLMSSDSEIATSFRYTENAIAEIQEAKLELEINSDLEDAIEDLQEIVDRVKEGTNERKIA